MSWSLTLQGSPYSHMYVLCSSAEQWDPAKSGTAFGVSRSDAPVKLEQLWSVLQCFTVLSQGDCVYYHVQTCMYTHHGHVIFNHLTSVNMGQFFFGIFMLMLVKGWYPVSIQVHLYLWLFSCGVCIIQKNPKRNPKLRFTSLSGWVWVKVCLVFEEKDLKSLLKLFHGNRVLTGTLFFTMMSVQPSTHSASQVFTSQDRTIWWQPAQRHRAALVQLHRKDSTPSHVTE